MPLLEESSKEVRKLAEKLKSLGLSLVESKIYLALLTEGLMGISELHKSTKIPRTTLVENIDKLMSKGLVSQTSVGARKKYSPEKPTRLDLLVREREISIMDEMKKIKGMKAAVPKIVQDIIDIIPDSKKDYHLGVRYYKGVESLKRVYFEEIFCSESISCYPNANWISGQLSSITDEFNRKLKAGELSSRDLMVEGEFEFFENLVSLKSQSPNYDYRVLSFDENLFGVDYTIFDNKIAMIYTSEEPIVVIIESEILSNHALAVFNTLWEMLPESTKQK